MTADGKADDDGTAEKRSPVDRARLAAIFGDALPDTTSDERSSDGADDRASSDEWIRRQIPPHHG